jgi:glycosyltransferase involved in cell wall biosynthesis
MIDLDPGKAIVLFVADSIANHRKGMGTLLDALPSIQAYCTIPIQLACIGCKPDTLPESVRWLGQITETHELASIYAAADLLVVPSFIDNAPNVIAEAHACGLPVLASDVGGIPEMITPGFTGMLIPASDSSSLSAAVIQFLPNIVANRKDWATRCRATAEERYAPTHVADQHLQVYRRALSAVGPVRRGRPA